MSNLNALAWLSMNCDTEDFDKLYEQVHDQCWTSNVIKYMEQYAAYKRDNEVCKFFERKNMPMPGNVRYSTPWCSHQISQASKEE